MGSAETDGERRGLRRQRILSIENLCSTCRFPVLQKPCSRPYGNTVPSRRELCFRQPGITFPTAGNISVVLKLTSRPCCFSQEKSLCYSLVSDLPVSHSRRLAQRRTIMALATATAASIQVMSQIMAQSSPIIAPISVSASDRTWR